MTKERLYILLNQFKFRFTKQQYLTIKGQIKSHDLQGAYKGIMRVINNEIRNNRIIKQR